MTNPVRRLHSANMKLLLRDLSFGPASVEELVEVLRVGKACVQRNLKAARDHALVLIVGWERTEGDLRPLYGLRSGPKHRECPRPSRLSHTEYSRRRRAKLKEKEI